MSNKISIFEIFKGNYKTLYDVNTSKYSYIDIATFYILPLCVALLCGYFKYEFSDKLTGHIINASALLSGLLLNLLILIFGLKDKLPSIKLGDDAYKKNIIKKRIMKELYFNVSSASLTSFFILSFSISNTLLVGSTFENINVVIINPIIAFLGVHLLVSFLMITKRTYRLLLSMQT